MGKKFLVTIVASILCCISAMAQRAGEVNVWYVEDWNHSGCILDLGLGGFSHDPHFGGEIDFGYRWHIYKGLCWDVIKVGTELCCCENGGCFSQYSNYRIVTGLHYNTPRFLAGKSLYIEAYIGYGHNFMDKTRKIGGHYRLVKDGAACGYGLGVNLSKLCALGVNFNDIGVSDDMQFFSLRCTLQF